MTPERRKANQHAYYMRHREEFLAKEKARYQANREAIRAQRNAYAEAHKDEINARAREAHRLNPERKRESVRRWRVRNNPRLRDRGLTAQVYDAMLELQENACAICWEPFTAQPKIDHDHAMGHVRGLLCHQCNVAIGLFHENPDYMHRAIRYLRAEQRPSKGEPYAPTFIEESAA